MAEAFALTTEDLRQLARNAVDASFLPDASKSDLHAEIDAA